MPIEAKVQLDPGQLKSTRAMYAAVRGGLVKASSSAMPIVVRKSRVSMVKAIAAEVAVPAGKLYERGNYRRPIVDRVVRSGSLNVGGEVTIKLGRIPLGRFSPTQHWKSSGSKRGAGGRFASGGRVRSRVSYKIGKGGGREKIADAFLIEFASGYEGIFRREGDSRLPLYELHGPSIPEVAEKNAAVRRVMDVEAGANLVLETDRRIEFMLKRAAAS